MKKVIIVAGIVSLALSSCNTNKLATYSDDVYANPTEERLEKARLAAEKKKKEEEQAKKEAEERAAELAAQKAKDDANPLYKDPVYDKDDYYDYQYASRIRRFNQPVCGVGYYDNYYTNYYWYNGNPGMYGTSIYSSYNYWGPSYSNYNCWPSSYFGVSYSWGYPNYGYSPYYGYNPYGGWGNPYSNGYWQGYYNGYNNGYYNGYYGYPYGGWGWNSPYYNGWGYYNQFDVNSAYNKPTNAPRGSHDGGNNSRVSMPGKYGDGLAQKYIQEVQVAQATTPKFTNAVRNTQPVKSNANFQNSNEATFGNGNNGNTNSNPNYNNNPKSTVNSNNSNDGQYTSPTYTQPKNNNVNNAGSTDAQLNTPPKTNVLTPTYDNGPTKPVKTTPPPSNPKGNIFDSGTPQLNNGGNNPPPPPSNSTPRGGNSGGGGHRPR